MALSLKTGLLLYQGKWGWRKEGFVMGDGEELGYTATAKICRSGV
jgi:hypothetical protein